MGTFLFLASATMCSSYSVHTSASTINTTTSARLKTEVVFLYLFSARGVLSSIPPVSRKTTGPIGKSSMVFSTTSVVVPAIGDVMATSCPATRFRKLDFPTFALPDNAICNLFPLGVLFISSTSCTPTMSAYKEKELHQQGHAQACYSKTL